MFDFN
jgi:hypothetical protein